jgi:heme/copper-type cytochrome/quinol oxidase subunit 1
MENLSLRFIRWSAGLLILGLLTGYGPLGHYLHGGVGVACPWAPIHGHVALLGWVGMTIFGLVYQALPRWANGREPKLRLAKIHFYLCVSSILGVFANGILGYRILDIISPDFHYIPNTQVLNLWLSIDGMFLTLYGLGCALFLVVVLRSTSYAEAPQSSVEERAHAV